MPDEAPETTLAVFDRHLKSARADSGIRGNYLFRILHTKDRKRVKLPGVRRSGGHMKAPLTGPLVLLLGTVLLAVTARAYEIRTLETSRADKRYSVTMAAVIDLPVDEVYRRLTDFNQLTQLSPYVEESRQLDPDEAGEVIVYTRIRACVMFVCKTVRIFEAVTYPARYQIVATVIPARSELAYGQSRWTLSPEGRGTLLQYESELEPGFDMFPLIGPAAARYSLKKQAKQFLEGLEEHR